MATLEASGGKKVVTACPHCFNSFKNEYPRLGSKFKVEHHTAFLGGLIEAGRLKLKAGDVSRITLHDPCYLSRHNGMTQAPRDLLKGVASSPLMEPERRGRNSFCCGGGGGMSFLDEPAGQRVNQERSRELISTGADTVAVACPFCTTMLEDGVTSQDKGRDVEVKEISELLLEATD